MLLWLCVKAAVRAGAHAWWWDAWWRSLIKESLVSCLAIFSFSVLLLYPALSCNAYKRGCGVSWGCFFCLGGGTACLSAGCLFYWLQSCTGCGFLYTCGYRARLRAKYGLGPEPCGDCCTDYWCLPCSLAQQYRELQYRGIRPALGQYLLFSRKIMLLDFYFACTNISAVGKSYPKWKTLLYLEKFLCLKIYLPEV